MFLESCGKLFFLKMRPVFFFSLLFSPLLFTIFFLYSQTSYFQDLENQFLLTHQNAKKAYEHKLLKKRFLARYSEPEPFYLDHKIESFPFLQKELEHLQMLIHHPALANKSHLLERIQFLSSERNRLAFKEENIQSSSLIKETEEKQRFPIQMDETDLKKLLCLIEDFPIASFDRSGKERQVPCRNRIDSSPELPVQPDVNRPQFLITDFHLQRKTTSLQTEVFEVEMQLLKREFTTP